MRMETTVPTPNETALLNEILAMQNDYDNGLREFQEAINYCIFHVFVNGCKNSTKKEAVAAVIYLRDLCTRLRKMEVLFSPAQ